MPTRKLFAILSCEWLPKIGDSEKLLVRFSIVDEVEGSVPGHKDVKPQAVIVKVSRSVQTAWQKRDSRFLELANLEKVLLHFVASTIRERVWAGEKLSPDEELEITTYSNFVPPDPDTIQMSLGQVEVIEVERKLGFLH
jgi:hypothetical protein